MGNGLATYYKTETRSKEFHAFGGLSWHDNAARFHDTLFPRFTTVDPLSGKYPHISPYTYCAANPIMFIDPTGMAEFWHNGEVIGTDGIDDGRILVVKNTSSTPDPNDSDKVILHKVKTSKVVDFIKTNSGKKDAFSENSDIYSSTIEIEGSAENRSQMVKIISQDSGKGGLGDNENREFGGAIKNGKVIEYEPGPVSYGGTMQIGLPSEDSAFHGHASGSYKVNIDGITYTSTWVQPPSQSDINTAGTLSRYVFGRGDKNVYIYNNTGVLAVFPDKYFIKPKKKNR